MDRATRLVPVKSTRKGPVPQLEGAGKEVPLARKVHAKRFPSPGKLSQ